VAFYNNLPQPIFSYLQCIVTVIRRSR